MSAKMHQLKKMLCRELDELAGKGELSMGDLEIANKLTDTIKNIDKIEMLEEGDQSYGRSMNSYGESYRRGSYRGGNSYGEGGSYANYSGRRYSMSGADDKMIEHMKRMLNKNVSPEEKEAIEWALQELER